MFSKKWWGKTLERAARAGAYISTTLIGSDRLGWMNLDWEAILRSTGIVMLLSLLGSILATNIGSDKEDPGVL